MLRVLRACALTARTEITACARPSAGILGDFGSPFFIRLDETAIFFGNDQKSSGSGSSQARNVRLGQKMTVVRGIRDVRFTPEADMLIVGINVCYVPKVDMPSTKGAPSLGCQRRVAIRRDANEVPIERDRSVHIRAVGHAKQGREILGRACQYIVAPDMWRFTLQEMNGL